MEGEEDKKIDDVQQVKEDAEEVNIDANVYEQSNDLMNEGNESEFSCFNPQSRSGHIVYSCKGSDAQGLWEGERRYNEFFKLHEKLD